MREVRKAAQQASGICLLFVSKLSAFAGIQTSGTRWCQYERHLLTSCGAHLCSLHPSFPPSRDLPQERESIEADRQQAVEQARTHANSAPRCLDRQMLSSSHPFSSHMRNPSMMPGPHLPPYSLYSHPLTPPHPHPLTSSSPPHILTPLYPLTHPPPRRAQRRDAALLLAYATCKQ